MNKVILIGNLAKDVDLKMTTNGKEVATCSIATNKRYRDQAGNVQNVVQFHNLVVWGKPAGIFAQYLHKGSKVAIVGELQTRDWMTKDNQKRYITEVLVSEFEFLTPANNQPKPAEQDYQQQDIANNWEPVDNTIDGGEEIKIENIPF